jgi:hypothetical protein
MPDLMARPQPSHFWLVFWQRLPAPPRAHLVLSASRRRADRSRSRDRNTARYALATGGGKRACGSEPVELIRRARVRAEGTCRRLTSGAHAAGPQGSDQSRQLMPTADLEDGLLALAYEVAPRYRDRHCEHRAGQTSRTDHPARRAIDSSLTDPGTAHNGGYLKPSLSMPRLTRTSAA